MLFCNRHVHYIDYVNIFFLLLNCFWLNSLLRGKFSNCKTTRYAYLIHTVRITWDRLFRTSFFGGFVMLPVHLLSAIRGRQDLRKAATERNESNLV